MTTRSRWFVPVRALPPGLLALAGFVVLALIVPQLYHLGSSLIIVLAALLPLSWDPNALVAMQTATPLDIAAMVISAALILHFVLVFPKESRLAGTWRWALVALYIPAVVLAVVTLSQLILVPEDFAAFWGTNSLRARDPTPQAAFAVFVLGLAMLRLLLLLMSRPAAAVRRQVTWLMFGLGVAGGIAFLGPALPVLLGASSQAIIVPGWKQLSILALLGAFGLAIYRYDIFDVVAIANRIVVYGIFMVSITLLYLALATLLGHLLRNLAPGLALTLVAILTTLLVVLIAQPLRDAIQDLVDGAFHRYQMDHQQLLRDYSRELAMLTDVPHLLDRIAGQIVAALHPMGLAIVLARQDAGFRVVIAPGFADIFYNNCFKNGVLPIVLDAATMDRLFDAAARTEGYRLQVDLEAQTITTPDGDCIRFEVDEFRRHCLLNGLDDIGLTLQHADAIRGYEARRKQEAPWLF